MKSKNNHLPSLSIILPTYNERDNIRILVPLLEKKFSGVTHEIIVVDDSSLDGTGEEVLDFSRRFPNLRLCVRKEKKGIGSALRYGYNQARYDVILSCDADLSFSADDLMKVYQGVVHDYDFVIGSRHSPLSFYEKGRLSIVLKYAVSRFGNFFLHTLFRIPVSDFSVNCRAIRRTAWQSLDTREDTNFFLFEMLFLAQRKGFRIGEVPVSFADRKYGSSKINHIVEVPKAFYKMIVFLFSR